MSNLEWQNVKSQSHEEICVEKSKCFLHMNADPFFYLFPDLWSLWIILLKTAGKKVEETDKAVLETFRLKVTLRRHFFLFPFWSSQPCIFRSSSCEHVEQINWLLRLNYRQSKTQDPEYYHLINCHHPTCVSVFLCPCGSIWLRYPFG